MKKLLAVSILAAMATGCITVNKNDGGNALAGPGLEEDSYRAKYDVKEEKVSGEDSVNILFGFITWGSSATHISDNVYAPSRTTDSPFDALPAIPPFSFFIGGSSSSKAAMSGAYANACDKAQADAIIGSRYKVTTEDYVVFKKVKAEVVGYPATMTGVEKIDPVDTTRTFKVQLTK